MVRIEAELSSVFPVQDKLLIEPVEGEERLQSGLVLPPTVKTSEKVMVGVVVRVGPGYPVPVPAQFLAGSSDDNPLKSSYLPLQAKVGDIAVFYQKNGVEIFINGKKYIVVEQSALLLLIRKEEGGSPLSSA